MVMSCPSVLKGYRAQALCDTSCRRRVHDLRFEWLPRRNDVEMVKFSQRTG